MSRMSRPGRQQRRMAAPRAGFRRDSQETDQRPLARTPQSPGVDSGNWRLGAAHAVEGRVRASPGLLTEAAPVFAEPATAVAYGGVLAALPRLYRGGALRSCALRAKSACSGMSILCCGSMDPKVPALPTLAHSISRSLSSIVRSGALRPRFRRRRCNRGAIQRKRKRIR